MQSSLLMYFMIFWSLKLTLICYVRETILPFSMIKYELMRRSKPSWRNKISCIKSTSNLIEMRTGSSPMTVGILLSLASGRKWESSFKRTLTPMSQSPFIHPNRQHSAISKAETNCGSSCKASREKACEFNEPFSGDAGKLLHTIHCTTDPLDLYDFESLASLYLPSCSSDEALELITNLNVRAKSIDWLLVEIIEVFKDIISPPIALLINHSFKEGVFLPCMKIALATPIFKTGDKHIMGRYRVYTPVCVLIVLSKLYERAYII